jgi:hypothetical protein
MAAKAAAMLCAKASMSRPESLEPEALSTPCEGQLDSEQAVPLRFVRGNTRAGWQLQHGRVLTFA